MGRLFFDERPPPAFQSPDVVSVVIPVFNGAAHLDRTLLSVRCQTHTSLEIIVVDDGSTDNSADIVRRHAEVDDRIKLIQQPNQGVAAARNTGFQHAQAKYVATIDADDLWDPEKISLQYAAASRHPREVGMVFNNYVIIDEFDDVLRRKPFIDASTDVLRLMARNNIVGNGSSPLMLKSAVLKFGGYDASLRSRNAQGCEDYKLYFSLIEHCDTIYIPQYLTGYRVSGACMSSDLDQMFRSRAIVTGEIAKRHPELVRDMRRGNVRSMRFLVSRAIRRRKYRDAWHGIAGMLRQQPSSGIMEFGQMIFGVATSFAGLRRRKQKFHQVDNFEGRWVAGSSDHF